jgi:hypothetical protein
MIRFLIRLFRLPAWRQIAKDPFGLYRLAVVTVELREIERKRLAKEIPAEMRRNEEGPQ